MDEKLKYFDEYEIFIDNEYKGFWCIEGYVGNDMVVSKDFKLVYRFDNYEKFQIDDLTFTFLLDDLGSDTLKCIFDRSEDQKLYFISVD